MLIENLVKTSIQLIRFNQHEAGSYIACPLYLNYSYCWLRDGTFIAYAMDLAGETESAGQFYKWVHQVLQSKRERVDELIAKHQTGQWIERNEFLNTRYHLNGKEDHSVWGHFQLDGYGTWLWGLAEHVKITGRTELLKQYRQSIELSVDYLKSFWKVPNYDCWEEFPDYIHPSTLVCIYGGLHSLGVLQNKEELLAEAEAIKQFLLEHGVYDGYFIKAIQPDTSGGYRPAHTGVDASLLWFAKPFEMFGSEHSIWQHTMKQIEADLLHAGIQRYVDDTYYGGGEWLLLTAWYGWVLAAQGDREGAQRCLTWIASKADALGRLSEQVNDTLRSEEAYTEWLQKWGKPANPLLWSHAMFLVLYYSLQQE